ncbi:hypothetical protein BDF19DRAFT_428398 [Syncephalis fuscata]|nr:hypothetical protein BDF19DRAFT_428398 [Syncephalis fuscata]
MITILRQVYKDCYLWTTPPLRPKNSAARLTYKGGMSGIYIFKSGNLKSGNCRLINHIDHYTECIYSIWLHRRPFTTSFV